MQNAAGPRYGPPVAKGKSQGENSAPGLARLPPGRHGLPREFVVENQRGRIAAGMIAAVSAHGYPETTISQIAEAAGISRRTFYSYFSSKEEAFFDTFDQVVRHLTAAMREAGVGAGAWPDQVRARLVALLATFAANPDLVRFALMAPAGAGGAIADRYRTTLLDLLAVLTEDLPAPPATREPSDAARDALVGGLAATIVARVRAGEGATLPDLTPDLLELVLAPYLGRDEAAGVARAA